jgi:hypothetical protein
MSRVWTEKQLAAAFANEEDKMEGQTDYLPKSDGGLPLLPGMERMKYCVIAFVNTRTVEEIQKRVGNRLERLDAEKKFKPKDLLCSYAILGIYETKEKAVEWANHCIDTYRNLNFGVVPFAKMGFFPSYLDPRLADNTQYANPLMQDFMNKHRQRQKDLQKKQNEKLENIQQKSDEVKELHDRGNERKQIEHTLNTKLHQLQVEELADQIEEKAKQKGDVKTLEHVSTLRSFSNEQPQLPPVEKLKEEIKKMNHKTVRAKIKHQQKIRSGLQENHF